ncbi:hypothetical protein [Mycolicibacterium sp. A43C]
MRRADVTELATFEHMARRECGNPWFVEPCFHHLMVTARVPSLRSAIWRISSADQPELRGRPGTHQPPGPKQWLAESLLATVGVVSDSPMLVVP